MSRTAGMLTPTPIQQPVAISIPGSAEPHQTPAATALPVPDGEVAAPKQRPRPRKVMAAKKPKQGAATSGALAVPVAVSPQTGKRKRGKRGGEIATQPSDDTANDPDYEVLESEDDGSDVGMDVVPPPNRRTRKSIASSMVKFEPPLLSKADLGIIPGQRGPAKNKSLAVFNREAADKAAAKASSQPSSKRAAQTAGHTRVKAAVKTSSTTSVQTLAKARVNVSSGVPRTHTTASKKVAKVQSALNVKEMNATALRVELLRLLQEQSAKRLKRTQKRNERSKRNRDAKRLAELEEAAKQKAGPVTLPPGSSATQAGDTLPAE